MYELYNSDFIDTEIEQCILPATQRKIFYYESKILLQIFKATYV